MVVREEVEEEEVREGTEEEEIQEEVDSILEATPALQRKTTMAQDVLEAQ